MLYILGRNPGFEGDLWWVGVMNVRTLVLAACGVATAMALESRACPWWRLV